MFSRMLVVIAVLLSGVTLAAAQSCQDPIDARQTLMKKSGAMAKAGSAMIKGETPFDLAKTQEIFAAFADDAAQMPKLFPDCSKTGEHSTAAATIRSLTLSLGMVINMTSHLVRVNRAQRDTIALESRPARLAPDPHSKVKRCSRQPRSR